MNRVIVHRHHKFIGNYMYTHIHMYMDRYIYRSVKRLQNTILDYICITNIQLLYLFKIK